MHKDINELRPLMEKMYEALDEFIKESGLVYDVDNDDYLFENVEDDDWGHDAKASVENAHADLGYLLEKE